MAGRTDKMNRVGCFWVSCAYQVARGMDYLASKKVWLLTAPLGSVGPRGMAGIQAWAQSPCPELSAQGLVPLRWGCALRPFPFPS